MRAGKVKFVISIAIILCCIIATLFVDRDISHDKEMLRIGISVYSLDDSYMKKMALELETKLEEAFKNNKLVLRYELLDAAGSEVKQIQQADYLLKQGMDILVLNLVNPSAAADILNQANKKGISVILFNREPNAKDINIGENIWYVGSDGKVAGELQAEMVIQAWNDGKQLTDSNNNGKIDYIMVEGEPAHYDTVRRTMAFLKNTTDIPMNQLANFSADWSSTQAYEEMMYMTDDIIDNIEAVICNNDEMAQGIYNYYTSRNLAVPFIVGINDTEEVHKLVDQGIIYGTVNLNQEQELNDIVYIIQRLSEGNEIEKKIWYSIPETYSLVHSAP